jgi:hypothetical protein
MRRARIRHRPQHLVEGHRRRDHDRLHRRRGRDVEQRRTGVGGLAGLQHGQPRRAAARPGNALGPRLPPPGEAGERDELVPVPHVHAAHTARAARAEHLLSRGRVGEPALPGQHPLRAGPVDVRRGHDRVPLVQGLLLDHRRQPGQVVDGRRGRVDAGHPGRVERRALARPPEQRPETFGPVALDPLARPVEPRHMVLERAAHRIQVRCAQTLVGRPPVLTGHADSVPSPGRCATAQCRPTAARAVRHHRHDRRPAGQGPPPDRGILLRPSSHVRGSSPGPPYGLRLRSVVPSHDPCP